MTAVPGHARPPDRRVPVVSDGRPVGIVTFDDPFRPAAPALDELADVVGGAEELVGH